MLRQRPGTGVCLLLAAVMFGGCALPAGSADADAPLAAYITGRWSSGVGFSINRPAHVALFEVVPGSSVSQVFPRPGLGSIHGLTQTSRQIPFFQSSRSTGTPRFANGFQSGPRIYFLIASEQPLRLDEFGAYGMRLNHGVASQVAYSVDPYRTMHWLANTALPAGVPEGSYVTDVYFDWPDAIAPARPATPGYVFMRCGGYELFVRFEYLHQVAAMLCGSEDPTLGDDQSEDRPVEAPDGVPVRRAATSEATSVDVRASTQLMGREAGSTSASSRAASERRWTPESRPGLRTDPGAERARRSQAAADAAARRQEVQRARMATPPSTTGTTAPSAQPAERPSSEQPSVRRAPTGGGGD